jgi:glutaredoxin
MWIGYEHIGVESVSRAKDTSLPQVTFYTKVGCHLCDEARDMLDDIAAETAFELTETDIRSSPELFEQYRYRIPVIIIDNTLIVEGRIEYRDLVQAFQEANQRRK